MVPQKKRPASAGKSSANHDADAEKKPEKKPEDEGTKIEIGIGNAKVSIDMKKNGVVIIYALAFAIAFGTFGLILVQLVAALKGNGVTIPAVGGFIVWSLTTCTLAWSLHLSP